MYVWRVLWWPCLSICLSHCVQISGATCSIINFLCMLPVAVVWFSSGGIAVCYVLLFCWWCNVCKKWHELVMQKGSILKLTFRLAAKIKRCGVYPNWLTAGYHHTGVECDVCKCLVTHLFICSRMVEYCFTNNFVISPGNLQDVPMQRGEIVNDICHIGVSLIGRSYFLRYPPQFFSGQNNYKLL